MVWNHIILIAFSSLPSLQASSPWYVHGKRETFPTVNSLADLTIAGKVLPATETLGAVTKSVRRSLRVSEWVLSHQATGMTQEPHGVPPRVPVLKYPACILSCFPGDRHGSKTLPRESPQPELGLFLNRAHSCSGERTKSVQRSLSFTEKSLLHHLESITLVNRIPMYVSSTYALK